MADESTLGPDSPLYRLTEKLYGITEQSLQITRSDYLERTKNAQNKRIESTRAKLVADKENQFSREQQGQEVQLTRDSQLFSSRSSRALDRITKANTLLAGAKEAGQQDINKSDINDLKNSQKKTGEQTTDGLKTAFQKTTEEIFEKVRTRIDDAGNLSDVVSAFTSDFNLILGKFGVLTSLPGFNTLKVTLQFLGKQVFNLVSLISSGLVLPFKAIGKGLLAYFAGTKLFQKFQKKFSKGPLKKDGTPDMRFKANQGSRVGRALGRVKERVRTNPVFMKIAKTVMSILNFFNPFKKLILVFVAIAIVIGLIKKFAGQIWSRIKQLGAIMKEAFMAAIKGSKDLREAKDSGLFTKRRAFQDSEVDQSKIKGASTQALRAIIAEEGDDISSEDNKAILDELSSRGEDTNKLLLDSGLRNIAREYRDSSKLDATPKIISQQNNINDMEAERQRNGALASMSGGPGGNVIQNNTSINKTMTGRQNTTIYSSDPQTQPQFGV